MDVTALRTHLERLPDAVEALVRGCSEEEWRWRPAEGGWSLIEIVGHLLAEEVDDFRARLRALLEDPEGPWPALDPEGAVREGRFQDLDPATTLERLRQERAASLAWLRGLATPRWENARPTRHGPLHAGDLLCSWAAHDARHLAQIARRLHGLSARAGAPFSVLYAG
jgi:uncharacterized damage-inducible protein DinB